MSSKIRKADPALKVGDLPAEEREFIELLRRMTVEDRAAVTQLLHSLAGDGRAHSVH